MPFFIISPSMNSTRPIIAFLAASLAAFSFSCSRPAEVSFADISARVMESLDDTLGVLSRDDARAVGIFLDSLSAKVQGGDAESMLLAKASCGEIIFALWDKYSRDLVDSVTFKELAGRTDAVMNAWKSGFTDDTGTEFFLWNLAPVLPDEGHETEEDPDDGMSAYNLMLFFDSADGPCSDIKVFLPGFYAARDDVSVNLAFADEAGGPFYLGGSQPVLADSSYAVCDFIPEMGGWVGSVPPFDVDKFFAYDRLFIMSTDEEERFESCTIDLRYLKDKFASVAGKGFGGFYPTKTKALEAEHEALAAEAEALGEIAAQSPASRKAWEEFSGFLLGGRTGDAASYYKSNQDAVLGYFRMARSRSRFTIELLYPVLDGNLPRKDLRRVYLHALESCKALADAQGAPADSTFSGMYDELLLDIEHFRND